MVAELGEPVSREGMDERDGWLFGCGACDRRGARAFRRGGRLAGFLGWGSSRCPDLHGGDLGVASVAERGVPSAFAGAEIRVAIGFGGEGLRGEAGTRMRPVAERLIG